MSFISWLKKIVSKQTSDAAKHQPDHQSLQEIEHPSVKLIYEQLNPSNKKEFPLLKPSHLNRYEPQRINLGYTNLHHSSQKINLIKDVNYLWVYNAKKELILGIEEPWKYPQAFIDRQNTEQLNFFNSKILPQLKKAGILGRVFKVFQTIKNLIKSLHSENGANGCQDLLLMTKCGTN